MTSLIFSYVIKQGCYITPKAPSGKKKKKSKLMADLDKKILSCEVTIDTYINTRKQVNVILLVVGQLVSKSCKMPNDHLF